MAGKDPLDEIRDDIEKKYRQAAYEVAREVTFQIEKAYESVISKFYNEKAFNGSNIPKVYKRTESTIKASDRWDDIFGVTPVGQNGYESGITVGAGNIPGDPYRADKEWVFTRTFEEGIHGFYEQEAKDWADERRIKLTTEAVMKNLRKKDPKSAQKLKKEMQRMERMIYSAPKFFRSPKEGMDNLFKTINSTKYLDKISKEKMKEVFEQGR